MPLPLITFLRYQSWCNFVSALRDALYPVCGLPVMINTRLCGYVGGKNALNVTFFHTTGAEA